MIVRVAAVPGPARCDDTYENHQQRFHGAELNYLLVCLRGIGGDASGDDSDADGGSGSAAKMTTSSTCRGTMVPK